MKKDRMVQSEAFPGAGVGDRGTEPDADPDADPTADPTADPATELTTDPDADPDADPAIDNAGPGVGLLAGSLGLGLGRPPARDGLRYSFGGRWHSLWFNSSRSADLLDSPGF